MAEQTGRVGVLKNASGAYLVEDATMYVAQHWALQFYAAQRNKGAHIHALRFDAGSGAPSRVNRPKVIGTTPTPAERVDLNGQDVTLAATPGSWEEKAAPKLELLMPNCCCFFTEVMLFCHGHQAGAFHFITDSLREILAGRPVEKFVFWSCRSSRLYGPSSGDFYYKVAGVFRPRSCGCGCDMDVCNAFDQDGVKRHCPDGKHPSRILASGHLNGKAVPLGIDPSSAGSPDGRLRDITIQPDGSTAAGAQVTAAMGPAGEVVFDGLTCGTDPSLVPAGGGPPNPQAVKDYNNQVLKASKLDKGRDQPYKGPTTTLSGCHPADGCLKGGTFNPPQSPP